MCCGRSYIYFCSSFTGSRKRDSSIYTAKCNCCLTFFLRHLISVNSVFKWIFFLLCLFSSSLRHYHYHHHSANENNVFSFIWKSNVIWWLSILFAIVACQFCIQVPLVSRRNKQIAMKAMPKVKLSVMRSIINFLKKLFLDVDKYHCNNVHMRSAICDKSTDNCPKHINRLSSQNRQNSNNGNNQQTKTKHLHKQRMKCYRFHQIRAVSQLKWFRVLSTFNCLCNQLHAELHIENS